MSQYYVHDLDPFLIQFSEKFGIRWYGIAYVAGFVVAYFILRYFAKKGDFRITPAQVYDLLFYMALGVMVGGRLGYCLFYDFGEWMKEPLLPIKFWDRTTDGRTAFTGLSGMASHGGFIGVILAILWYAHTHKISKWNIGDHIATAVPWGLGFGRIANFINGELWGRPASVPWAVIFPDSYPAVPRHPSQIYEALFEGFLIGAILLWYKRKPRPDGVVSGLFLLLYGCGRIFCEFFRQPDEEIGFQLLGLTRGQWLSMPLVVAGIIITIWFSKTRKSAEI